MARKCVFCSRTDEHDAESDHLRTVCLDRAGKYQKGYFRPKLSEQEMAVVKAKRNSLGEADICSNRNSCRRRRLGQRARKS